MQWLLHIAVFGHAQHLAFSSLAEIAFEGRV
jgi:hypothetical protein